MTNESDPNYEIYWDFCEFTFNAAELYINISYVDFVSLPIGLRLENTSGTVTTVDGLPATGLDTICAGLMAQTATDGSGWSDLIIKTSSGANLRALSPNSGITMNNSLFSTYFDPYIQDVWAAYGNGTNLVIDTQASWGALNGTISDDVLSFGSSVGSFSVPTSADIFSCSSGPFATSTNQMGAVGARLAAAFNRSTLLIDAVQPNNELVADYYTNPITNHYARLMHATYLDGKGYAFPYDDVSPADGADQSGSLYDPNPQLLTVMVGGTGATSKTVKLRDMATRAGQRPAGRRQWQHQRIRRDLAWRSAESEKQMLASAHSRDGGDSDLQEYSSEEVDLEKGLGQSKHRLSTDERRSGGVGHLEPLSASPSLVSKSLTSLVPPYWAERVSSLLVRLETSPIGTNMRPMVDCLVRIISSLLNMSVRALVSRVTMALLLVLFYLVVPLVSKGEAGALASMKMDAGAGTVGGMEAANGTSTLVSQ